MDGLSTRLRSLRRSRVGTQATLAARSGISKVTINRIERGHVQEPREGVLQSLAAALDTTLEFLVAGQTLEAPPALPDALRTQVVLTVYDALETLLRCSGNEASRRALRRWRDNELG